ASPFTKPIASAARVYRRDWNGKAWVVTMFGSNCYQHPREEILQSMERIYRYRMTTTSGGNLSIREPNGDVWITPARVDKGSLGRADIVMVRADGTVEGQHPPSSELPLHQAIYRARPDVSG